jgi:hypothetical protein
MSNFSYSRRAPINVLIVAVDFNLVEIGGKGISTLREDFYDNAVNITNNSRISTSIVSPYDIALSGGEPYSVWR